MISRKKILKYALLGAAISLSGCLSDKTIENNDNNKMYFAGYAEDVSFDNYIYNKLTTTKGVFFSRDYIHIVKGAPIYLKVVGDLSSDTFYICSDDKSCVNALNTNIFKHKDIIKYLDVATFKEEIMDLNARNKEKVSDFYENPEASSFR